MAGVTLAPAVIYVAGYLPPPAGAQSPAIHLADLVSNTAVSPGYHAGTASYHPGLGQPIFYAGGAIT
jgi:hypothetical protein